MLGLALIIEMKEPELDSITRAIGVYGLGFGVQGLGFRDPRIILPREKITNNMNNDDNRTNGEVRVQSNSVV